MRAIVFSFLTVFAAFSAAPRVPASVLTLERAVAIALEGNPRLGAAAANVAAAGASVDQARSARLPRVDLEETFSRSTNPVVVFSNLLGQEAFGPLALATINEPSALDNFNTRVSVSQPVWTGGRIRGGLRTAVHSREAVEAERERVRQEVVHEVTEAYSGALLAVARLDVARQARETARAHVEMVGDLYEGGLVVESDLLQARVRESEIEEMVIRAESAVAVSRAALNLVLGRELDTPLSLAGVVEVADARDTGPLDALVAESRGRRPDLQAARSRLQAARSNETRERAGYFPEVAAVGAFETNAEDFVGTDGTNWSVSLAVRFNAFDGNETRARVRRAREEARRAEWLRKLRRQSAELEVRRAFHDLRASRQRLEQARGAVSLAEQGLRMVEDRYREGLATLVELLDAETALTRARTREVSARRNVIVSGATLDLAVGRSRP